MMSLKKTLAENLESIFSRFLDDCFIIMNGTLREVNKVHFYLIHIIHV